MRRILAATLVVMTGVLTGTLLAQTVSTELKYPDAHARKPNAARDYPELSNVSVETLSGARSEPYDFAPLPLADWEAGWSDDREFAQPQLIASVSADEGYQLDQVDASFNDRAGLPHIEGDEADRLTAVDKVVVPLSKLPADVEAIVEPPPAG